ncbi:hypothetical protein [Amycolatopsis methanolica]|uniref:Uncharacterized protein n=1 Tax=Amycolatopsis methanolica 239 TaxID=1068978 RepID=A0A076N735_AMYME|nr:hypothetical protein [Amycolatopsis methanolica]AIJ25812.1 hypothetical protein AMETH_5720 [Amycolatopsis methanolica 239]
MKRALLFLLLPLAACTNDSEPTETRAPATTSSAPPAVTAADGRDYGACLDGTCEVLVSEPVDIALTGQGGVDRISVRAVTAEGIEFSTGDGSGILTPGCVSTLYENGSGSRCSSGEPAKPEPVDGVLAMQVVDVRDGTAVLRLVSGGAGPPPSSLRPPLPVIPTWRP